MDFKSISTIFYKNAIVKYFKERAKYNNDKKHYINTLKGYLSDGILDEEEKTKLSLLASDLKIKEKDLSIIHRSACIFNFNNIIGDGKITEQEANGLTDLLSHFNISKEEINFNQGTFNKYYILGQLDLGILPEAKVDVQINLKPNEILHWACVGEFRKVKSRTERINYGGLTGSIKIAKGIRYRVGSIGVQYQKVDYLATEDAGAFYITSKKIGFLGSRKSFSIAYDKILSSEVSNMGYVIFKENKEAPFIVGLEDYELPVAIISCILNR